MTKKILPTQEQLDKLSRFQKLAEQGVSSNDLVTKIGGITIFAGIADFYTIQSARLIEQIILKSELLQNKKPSFIPHEDNYFYDEQIDSRKIINKIKEILPFKYENDIVKENEINTTITDYLNKTNEFLNYRNTFIHHIGNPKISDIKFTDVIDKAIKLFDEMMDAHRIFFETCQPYRFGPKEIEYFYGKNH